ncbi:hypothetical protein ACFVH6_32685 [Spirillospora sp. NPDC127200]
MGFEAPGHGGERLRHLRHLRHDPRTISVGSTRDGIAVVPARRSTSHGGSSTAGSTGSAAPAAEQKVDASMRQRA